VLKKHIDAAVLELGNGLRCLICREALHRHPYIIVVEVKAVGNGEIP
jgi:hypothetical protein